MEAADTEGRMRQAVILAGGRGTRLGALARDIPKPLMPVAGDVRFLDYLLHNIARHGVEDIILLAGHLAAVVRERYDGARVLGARVRVAAEPEPAGTGGALRYAADTLDDVFLMANGDSFLDMNYLALAQALGGGDIGAMALRRVPNAARFGRVETQGDRVVGFHEKDASFQGEALISAGVYVLRRAVLDHLTPAPCSLETDVFPKLAQAGALAGAEFDGYFIDIGLPETLSEARAALPAQMRRAAVLFDRDGTLIHDEGYTYKPEALRWRQGAVEAIRACNDSGRLAIVVTNQAGVARGLYSEDDVRAFHAHMQAELLAHGAHIDTFYHCPYHGEGVVPEFAFADHPDRKPNPGMLRRALAEWPIDAAASVVVGDKTHDVEAARAAGLRGILVAPGELLAAVSARPSALTMKDDSAAKLKQRAAAARAWLFEHALPLWWERGFDRAAKCFHERLNLDGSPVSAPRRIRVQARQTAVYARAGRLGWGGPWREATEAGAAVLLQRGLRADGGVRHALDDSGHPLDDRRDLYDLAFVVFALAEAAQALGERPDLITAAAELADWAARNWSHPQGGFREGDITPTPPRRQNPHMHMFEAMLALHEASGEPRHLDRASEIARLLETRLLDARHGALPEYFDDAWRPQAGGEGAVCEPGHHFEWSWLLCRWHALGGGNLGEVAEKLRVHAEIYGVERDSEAVYDAVFLDGRARVTSSRFWPHTERIKANLVRYERTRDPNAADAAARAFDMLMRYCDTPLKGLWRDKRLPEGVFVEETAPASSFYHAMLAMFELIRVADALD